LLLNIIKIVFYNGLVREPVVWATPKQGSLSSSAFFRAKVGLKSGQKCDFSKEVENKQSKEKGTMINTNKQKLIMVIMAFFSLLIVTCGDLVPNGSQSIDYDLLGTWERTEPAFWPEGQTLTSEKGQLILDYYTITIIGPIAHLKDYPRNTPLEAYTEDDNIYIKIEDEWKEPVPYKYWLSGASYSQDKMLTLKGSGINDEYLKKIGDAYE
jgi:hypothetical protein